LTKVTEPRTTDRAERVSGLRFAEARVQALFQALVMFRLLPMGFSNRDLRAHLATMLGLDPATMTQGRMTYDLRRLRLHGLIERMPKTHRYRVTDTGLRSALFLTRAYARILRPGLSMVMPDEIQSSHQLRVQFDKLERVMDQWVANEKLAA